jgi:hypothetical protein
MRAALLVALALLASGCVTSMRWSVTDTRAAAPRERAAETELPPDAASAALLAAVNEARARQRRASARRRAVMPFPRRRRSWGALLALAAERHSRRHGPPGLPRSRLARGSTSATGSPRRGTGRAPGARPSPAGTSTRSRRWRPSCEPVALRGADGREFSALGAALVETTRACTAATGRWCSRRRADVGCAPVGLGGATLVRAGRSRREHVEQPLRAQRADARARAAAAAAEQLGDDRRDQGLLDVRRVGDLTLGDAPAALDDAPAPRRTAAPTRSPRFRTR